MWYYLQLESCGTVTKEISEDERSNSCLTRELAEKLGKIALKVIDLFWN